MDLSEKIIDQLREESPKFFDYIASERADNRYIYTPYMVEQYLVFVVKDDLKNEYYVEYPSLIEEGDPVKKINITDIVNDTKTSF